MLLKVGNNHVQMEIPGRSTLLKYLVVMLLGMGIVPQWENSSNLVNGLTHRDLEDIGNQSLRDSVQIVSEAPQDLEELSDEKRLVQDLLRRYERVGTTGRPVRNASTSVKVYFGLGLIKMTVKEKDNMLSMSAWTRYRWTDEYLRWRPKDYGGIDQVKLPQTKIWTPDIMLYNTGNTDKFEREALAVVGQDGTVSWFPQRIYHSSCSIDVRTFPFDNQTCHMWFGSWTHTVSELDLQLAFAEGIDLSTFAADFRDSSKWNIENVVATRLASDGNGPHFAVLSFVLYLQRRMIFSSYILTFPVLFLSFLTLLVFWLPAGSTDKSGLGLTIFGSLLLLLLILVEAAPPTASGVPLLGVYYCFNIVIVIMSIFLSSLVNKIGAPQRMGIRRKVPHWVRVIFFRGFGTLLCLRSHAPYPHKALSGSNPDRAGSGSDDNGDDDDVFTPVIATDIHALPRRQQAQPGPDEKRQPSNNRSMNCSSSPLSPTAATNQTGINDAALGNTSSVTTISLQDYSRAIQAIRELYGVGGGGGNTTNSSSDTLPPVLPHAPPRMGAGDPELWEQLSVQLGELLRLLQYYVRGRRQLELLQRSQVHLDEEWAFLAEILDKIFFIIYIIVIMLSIVFFFPR